MIFTRRWQPHFGIETVMSALSSKSVKIQELANLKADGELSTREFQKHMAAILGGGPETTNDNTLPEAPRAAPKQEESKCDNCTALAGAMGIAGLAVTLLLIALGLAHQKTEAALLRKGAALPAAQAKLSADLPLMPIHTNRVAS
jgi:hypothetical protein